MAVEVHNTAFVRMEAENELRILIDEKTHGTSTELLSGDAEIYGTPMILNKLYEFPPNTSIAIYSWVGCNIKVAGNVKSINLVKDTLMMINVSIHAYLQEQRNLSEVLNTKGPVTLICGPADVGKSTLCRILLNYTAAMGKQPLFIDLDVGQNSISVPGTVGILRVETPADIVEGFKADAANTYHFGYKNPGHNIYHYLLLLKHLGMVVKNGMQHANPNVKSSGIIINTCGWVRGHGYDAITLACLAFEVNIVCVISEEQLCQQLEQDVPSSVKIHYVPKLSGVVERPPYLRAKKRAAKISEYFFGSIKQLSPSIFDVPFSEFKVYRIVPIPVDEEEFDSTAAALHDITVEPVDLCDDLIDEVLALMKFDDAENVIEEISVAEILGFICVQNVDSDKSEIKILSPQPRPLPSKVLLIGDFKLCA